MCKSRWGEILEVRSHVEVEVGGGVSSLIVIFV